MAPVGRDEELGVIDAFLTQTQRGQAALVLAGEAGIGKTTLWAAGIEAAERRLCRVVICRGVEAEATLSFAGLSELLAPVLGETLGSLVQPRRRALEVALLLAEPGEMTPDTHAIGLAVLDVLRVLVERGPVVVAIDDIQWLDPATAAVLEVALRRLGDEPVGLLGTVRAAPDVFVPIELERCFPEARRARLSVGPLSVGAVHHLLRDRVGLDLSRPELVSVHQATGGNPFFAVELGRELARLGTRLQPGLPLPVPSSRGELLGARVARLSGETRDVLLVAALAGRPTLEVIAAVHGGHEAVAAALVEAAGDGVVDVADGRVHFTHPLLASVLYERASLTRRRDVHGALAGAVSDLEERARHLARATNGPDDVVAAELAAAAEHAAARGATAAGAELFELAAGWTPDDPALARKRRMRAATLHRLAGDGKRAVALLEQLRSEVPPGPERADVYFELAYLLPADVPTIVELCDEALAEAAGDDARCVRILNTRTWAHFFAADAHAALIDARAALERAERTGDPTLLAVALCSVGSAEMWTADVTPDLLERGAEIEELHGLVLDSFESPRAGLARLLMCLGEIDRSRALCEDLDREAAARGDERSRLVVLHMLGSLEWMAGHWPQALVHAAALRELAEQTSPEGERAWLGLMRARVEADLGLVEESRAAANEALAFAEPTSNDVYVIASLGVLGQIELSLGNLDGAAGYLRELPGRLISREFNEPMTRVWGDTIETLAALGEPETAGAHLEHYEAQARRFPCPWALAVAARCRGLLRAAEGDVRGAATAFELALAEQNGLAYPFERARTQLALGSVRRQLQQKSAARAALEEALATFDQLGARLWADKARDELRRISGRRPAADGLTETESQVAILAGQGLTNKEIASALFMGLSTVEGHLSRVYRKLGVRRAQLTARLVVLSDQAANSKGAAAQT